MAKSVNKVIYGNRTVVDMTDATVTPETLVAGVTAYSASGNKVTGTLPYSELLSRIAELEVRMGYPGAAYPSGGESS